VVTQLRSLSPLWGKKLDLEIWKTEEAGHEH